MDGVSRSFANGGRADVAWQGPSRRVGKGREGGCGWDGGCVWHRATGSGRGGGGADGLSRALEMDDLQQANRNRHRTRFAKLLLLMAHVRCSRVAKVGRWAPCHTRTAEGGERSNKRGFLAAAEKADAAALFVARAVQVCREPWQKNAKKQDEFGARHVMSLIIHRSTAAPEMWYLARHVFRSKCSLGHVIGGHGKQRFHHGLGTPWSPPACALRWSRRSLVIPPSSVSRPRRPAQVGFAEGSWEAPVAHSLAEVAQAPSLPGFSATSRSGAF